MKVLIVTLGSHGDVHPFCGLGVALRGRGHDVTVMANDYFRPLIERAGLLAGPAVGTADEYRALMDLPDLWHPRRSTKLIMDLAARGLQTVYDPVVSYANQNPGCVVIASSLGFAVRCAQDKLGFPMATIHLSPFLRTIHAPPKLPGLFMPRWMPMWMRARLWEGADRFVLDPMIAPALNAFRAQHGLPPASGILSNWLHSPDRLIGMWPPWFAPMQPDWPPQTVLTGFPLWDERGLEPLDENLLRFLDAGDAPIAFTPGSAMAQGQLFFAAAVDACRRLGRRGILLTRQSSQMPAHLPPSMIHIPFAPFSGLLPRCAALVHHGGIGTTSQSLRAGTPQLVMAMAHDQPDNADRAVKLGVAATIKRRKFTGRNVARALAALLSKPALHDRCAEVAGRFVGHDALTETAMVIERMSPAQPAALKR
jgi:UDP:flavonoid glycosyltransferase YjiC (YdhE family)